jgi:hypothetical protein
MNEIALAGSNHGNHTLNPNFVLMWLSRPLVETLKKTALKTTKGRLLNGDYCL